MPAAAAAFEQKAPVAIAAIDVVFVAHLQPHARVTEGAADAVTGHAFAGDFDGLGRGWGDGVVFHGR